MGNFNRDNRSGGGRSFGGGRNMGRPQMHKATCNQCGNECEIPFKPTGSRPVFCSTCFETQGGGKSFDRPRFNDRKPNFNDRRSNSDDKQMHEAVCAKCGETCEVPFKPMIGKPVYCTQCFEKGGKNTLQFKEQFDEINAKLDKIMKALKISVSTEKVQELVKEEKPKKTAKKTPAQTKTPAKKILKKKKK